MKLVLAIIQQEDWRKIREIFVEKNLPLTFFKSRGGFLQETSITLLTAVEDERLEEVMTVLRENCKEREKVIIPPIPSIELLRSIPMPVKIKVGGAVVFVLDISYFEKI